MPKKKIDEKKIARIIENGIRGGRDAVFVVQQRARLCFAIKMLESRLEELAGLQDELGKLLYRHDNNCGRGK